MVDIRNKMTLQTTKLSTLEAWCFHLTDPLFLFLSSAQLLDIFSPSITNKIFFYNELHTVCVNFHEFNSEWERACFARNISKATNILYAHSCLRNYAPTQFGTQGRAKLICIRVGYLREVCFWLKRNSVTKTLLRECVNEKREPLPSLSRKLRIKTFKQLDTQESILVSTKCKYIFYFIHRSFVQCVLMYLY